MAHDLWKSRIYSMIVIRILMWMDRLSFSYSDLLIFTPLINKYVFIRRMIVPSPRNKYRFTIGLFCHQWFCILYLILQQVIEMNRTQNDGLRLVKITIAYFYYNSKIGNPFGGPNPLNNITSDGFLYVILNIGKVNKICSTSLWT